MQVALIPNLLRLADYLDEGWKSLHPSEASHIPLCIERFGDAIKALEVAKRPSALTVRRQFSALRV